MKKYVYNGTSYVREVPEGELALWKAQGYLGAKNLLKFPYASNSQTISGVTFTVNDDGSITVNGTATANLGITLSTQDFGDEEFSTVRNVNPYFVVSGLPSNSNFYIKYFVSGTSKQVRVIIANGYEVDNVTVYPMIRYAGDPDDEWQPYAPTNKELYTMIQALQSGNSTDNGNGDS